MNFISIKTKNGREMGLPSTTFNFRKIKSGAGFTLIEIIIALFVITVGLSSVFVAINKVVSANSTSSNRLVASYLAQEGIEVVRNIRDTNWLNDFSGSTWTQGMIIGSNSEISYDYSSLYPYTERFLKLGSLGFYNYSEGEETLFKRRVRVNLVTADQINVIVEISWIEKGINYSLIIEEDLYNWIQ